MREQLRPPGSNILNPDNERASDLVKPPSALRAAPPPVHQASGWYIGRHARREGNQH
jgi:hypothetical protein